MLGVIFALVAVVNMFSPGIAQLLLGIVGGEDGAYTLLVQLPVIPEEGGGGWVWPGTNTPFDPGTAGFIGPAAHRVFMLIRDLSLMFFALVLIVAAICYLTESFRVMREGTALSIITGSLFALIMIFLSLPLYNTVAALFNEITRPGGYILDRGMIGDLVGKACWSGGVSFSPEAIIQFFGSVLFLALTAIVLVAVAVLGIMRLFMIGALVATLPLWIILHAIPPVRRIGESMIEHLIGLVMASLIAAIILRFGYEVTCTADGFQGLMAVVAALASLIVAAMMPTVLAPRLGGLMVTGAMMATHAATVATQATIGTAIGGVAGFAGYIRTWWGARAAGERAPGARAALASIGQGMVQGLASGLSARPVSFGWLGAIPSPRVAVESARGGVMAGKTVSAGALKGHLGSALEGLIYQWGSSPVPQESVSEGLAWYNSIKNDPAAIGREFAKAYPKDFRAEMFRSESDYASLGLTLKPMLDEAAAKKPILLYRIKSGLSRIAQRSDAEKKEALKKAFKNSLKMKGDFEKVLGSPVRIDLEKFDRLGDYYRRVFTEGAVPEYYGKAVGGAAYELMLRNYEENLPSLDPDAGRMLLDQWLGIPEGKYLSDEEAGRWVSENLGPIPREYWKPMGHAFKQMMIETSMREPRLLTNFFNNLERAKIYGGKMPDLKDAVNKYEILANSIEEISRKRLIPSSTVDKPPSIRRNGCNRGGGGQTQPPQSGAERAEGAGRERRMAESKPKQSKGGILGGEEAEKRGRLTSALQREGQPPPTPPETPKKKKRDRKFVVNHPDEHEEFWNHYKEKMKEWSGGGQGGSEAAG